MELILEVEEGPELLSSLFDKQVSTTGNGNSQPRSCVFTYR